VYDICIGKVPNYERADMSISEQQQQQRREMLAKSRELILAGHRLVSVWQELNNEDNSTTGTEIPFGSSFDEEVYAWSEWLANLEDKWGK
jgi:hypothetical protein